MRVKVDWLHLAKKTVLVARSVHTAMNSSAVHVCDAV